MRFKFIGCGQGVKAMLGENHETKLVPLRILVVDDNVDLAVTTAALLRHLGHDVLVEHTPQAALECADTKVFDFCLLDIGLPQMDGYELAAQLRAKPNTCNAVYAAHTGYGSEAYLKKSASEGFSYHLAKPIAIQRLFEIFALKH